MCAEIRIGSNGHAALANIAPYRVAPDGLDADVDVPAVVDIERDDREFHAGRAVRLDVHSGVTTALSPRQHESFTVLLVNDAAAHARLSS